MPDDAAFASLFARLHPLLARGPAQIAVIVGHEVVCRGWGWNGSTGALAECIARNIPALKARFNRVGLVIETPDHISHFVRVI